MGVSNMVDLYLKGLNDVRNTGEKLATMLCNVIKKVLPDIEWSLGWAEAGIDTICFYSNSRYVLKVSLTKALEMVRLEDVIKEVFPELRGHVDCPYGVYLTVDEAERLKELLQEVK